MPSALLPCTSIEAVVVLSRRHGVSRRAVRALAHAGLLDIYRIRRRYYANEERFAQCVAANADLIARVNRSPRSLPVQLLAALPEGTRPSQYIEQLVAADQRRRAARKTTNTSTTRNNQKTEGTRP